MQAKDYTPPVAPLKMFQQVAHRIADGRYKLIYSIQESYIQMGNSLHKRENVIHSIYYFWWMNDCKKMFIAFRNAIFAMLSFCEIVEIKMINVCVDLIEIEVQKLNKTFRFKTDIIRKLDKKY